jgi:hypothetical protein
MRIRTETGKRRAHINVNARQDGKPGVVISQSGATILMSRDEWLEVRKHADVLLEPKERGRMLIGQDSLCL